MGLRPWILQEIIKKIDLRSIFLLDQQGCKPNSVSAQGGCDYLSALNITVGVKRTTFNPPPYTDQL